MELGNAAVRLQHSYVVPPLKFAYVEPGVYRSGFINRKNFTFLQTLKLKTIIYLHHMPYPEENMNFIEANNIKFIQIPIPGKEAPIGEERESQVVVALLHILDTRNYPVLVHCNMGSGRVGCLFGCLRKLQGWALTSIFEEYNMFTGLDTNTFDQEFMEFYSREVPFEKGFAPSWI